MADDNADLVSQISIQGADESAAKIKAYAADGAEAFDALASAADKSAKAVSNASGDVEKSFKKIEGAASSSSVPEKFSEIDKAATRVGESLGTLVRQTALAGAGVVALGATAIGAVAGFAKLASSITAAARGTTEFNNDAFKQQQIQNRQQAQGVASAVSYQNSIEDLQTSLRRGKIDYVQYGQAVRDLNTQMDQQKRVQQAVQAAQEDAAIENNRIQRLQAQAKAVADLQRVYGGPLTASLISLGTTYDRLADRARGAFGPVLASLVDKITALIDRNSVSIGKFFDSAANAAQSLITRSGPAIEKVIQFTVDLGKAVYDVFTTLVIPAVNTFITILGNVLSTFNAITGANITPGFVIITAAVISLSGAVSALITVVTLARSAIGLLGLLGLGPLGIAIGVVVAALALLATTIDWSAFAARAQEAATSIIGYFAELPGRIGAFFTTLWTNTQQLAATAATAVVDAWNATVEFFSGLPDTIGAFFTTIGQSIIDAFNNAIETVKGYFASLYQAAVEKLQPIIEFLKTILGLQGQAAGGGGDGAVTAAGGGHIRGPGTWTSDSIPAWLSNNEFVIRARAVAKYGVNFLRAINSGKLDLSRIARFAVGGLATAASSASSPTTRIARITGDVGSPGSAMTPLNLSILGETFAGLMAPAEVADRLTQFAVARQSQSAGRKPAWVGSK